MPFRVLLAVCTIGATLLSLTASTTSVRAAGWWAQTLRAAQIWSGPDTVAVSFGELPRGSYVLVMEQQPFPGQARLYVQEATEQAFGYVDAIALAPSGAPPGAAANGLGGQGAPAVVGVPLFQPFWIANHAATSLWATPNADAAAQSELPQFTKLLVLAPATGQRYYVQDARTERLGYVDAATVGPSDPPTPEEIAPPSAPAPPPAPAYRPWWVAAHRATELWSGMEGGVSFAKVARGDQFLVMAPQSGPRLHVLNPQTKNYAYIDALAVGPSSGPKAVAIEVKGWRGAVTGDIVNLRPEPHTFIAPNAQVLSGDEITISAWIEGEELDTDNRTWGRVTGVKRRNRSGAMVDVELSAGPAERLIYSGLLKPLSITAPPAAPSTTLATGTTRWFDVNLSQQTVAAYEGQKAVYLAVTTSGRPGWETPVGTFRIQRRVENETMIGSTLLRLDTFEIPDYRLENVKWTQYFTAGGAALHTNYWRPAALFGMPSSHGCLGLLEKDAKWLWDWATNGTPLVIHY